MKAEPQQLLFAQQRLLATQAMLARFSILHLDAQAMALADQLRQRIKARKRYADFLLAAQALAGQHILVTRNTRDFQDIMPRQQLQNWIDERIG